MRPRSGADRKEGDFILIHEEMQNVMDRMREAYRAGDAAGCAALFTPDGELHSPYAPPARGRAEIEALHRIWTVDGENKELRVLKAGASADLAWCLAAYSEGDVSGDGTSVCVMERQADGGWLICMCSLNSTILPPEA